MRIRSVSAEVRSLAKLGSAARGYAALDAPTFVLCRVEGEDGLVGQGVTGRFLATQVADLIAGGMAEALVGQDASRIEAIGPALAARFNPRGAGTVFTAALSALDMALWDLRARALGEPLWRLLGGARETVPCYATVGLPGYDEAELVAVCKQSVDAGYLGVKMLVAAGGRSVAEDAARVRAVRAAIGPAARLIIDANCGMNLGDAKRLALMVEECDIAWFEEPLRDNDIEALVALRRAVRVPIGAGQMMHGLVWFREALTRGALDWVQPNAAFCGGITGLMRVLALAEAHGLPVAHAGGWDIANAAALAGHGVGGWLEMHGAQASLRAMLAEDMVAEGGVMRLPERPGIGFAFR
ncbi:mandelate racemase/muconate lactonizing enzyme family protein [Sabulicella rubraurantiaca]|uniref:mandelate racemase/muconate lactonizing enzyme family protein n=1 Tax=Sabulicella rubraurantiaca TaxID=2811429 RepID=UPI001A96C95F|nr:mandelate racemase/muconate lactonizing enzyme family protein [Sabulicella rubraurantiaca]